MRRQAKASTASGAVIPDGVGAQIVGDERQAPTIGGGDGAEIEAAFATVSAETTGQKTMSAAAGAGPATAKHLTLPSRGKTLPASEPVLVEQMEREAAGK